MKTTFRQTAALFCVGTALTFGAATVRADDDAKPRHHRRHHQEAVTKPASTESARASSGQIPTRDDRHSEATPGRPVGGANGPEYRVRTGSHIPERYNREGYSTDSRDNLFIYDKNDTRLRSTNNVGDSLRSVPGVSVSRP